jgi:hypothetical protein
MLHQAIRVQLGRHTAGESLIVGHNSLLCLAIVGMHVSPIEAKKKLIRLQVKIRYQFARVSDNALVAKRQKQMA